jgi:RHS repeat-associated protein
MKYDASGNVSTIKDPRNNVTTQYFDARNRLVKVVLPAVPDALAAEATPEKHVFKNPVSSTVYDAAGRVSSVTDPLGNTIRTFYDAAGRVIATVDARDQVTSTQHDPAGHVTAVINAKGQRLSNRYDALGRLVESKDAEAIVNSFDYDVAGNRTRVTDGLNRDTTFEYDLLSRLKKQTFANVNFWVYNYNAVNKISEVDPNGKTFTFQYDIRQRLQMTAYSTYNRDLAYNTEGRLSKVTELGITADKTVEYGYDRLGRIKKEKSVGVWHFYENDKAGNRTAATYADGRRVATAFDALNRPEKIVNDNGTYADPLDDQVTKYGYDRAGRAVIMTAANGQVTRNTYDELGHLVARVLYPAWSKMTDAQRLASFTWLHDELGNVISQTEYWFASGNQPARERATTMTYDEANRLITEVITEPGLAQVTTSYAYDAANNRTTKAVTLGAGTAPANLETGHWTYTYNSANQLTKLEKRASASTAILATTAYTYDANGNRISKVESVPATSTVTNRTTNYTWDVFNRLATVAHPVSNYTARQTYTYTYDYRTRRTGIARTAVTGGLAANHTAVVFSGGLSVADYERATNTALTDASTTITPTVPTLEYSRGPDMGGGVGGLLGTLRNPLNTSKVPVNPTTLLPATIRYNLSNGRGDIVAQSDGTGALTWTASYEAYGKRTKETGTNADKQRANTKDEDPTGLLNEGFRYRDIETGVWLSRDPAGFVDGPNLYAYVKQNPWTSFDPDGLYQMMPAAILHANGINTTSHDYQRGVQQGMAQGAKIGLVMTVGVGVTVATGGLATAASAAVFGSGTVATSLSAAALSGAAGSIAANSTGNVLDGRPVGEGTLKAGTTGALFGAAGQVVGNSALAFKQGMAEASGLAASAKTTASTANALAEAGNASGGAAGGLVTGGPSAMGLSHRAAGGVTPSLDPRVQSALDSVFKGMRSPFHGGCAEPQMASALLRAGGSTEGAVSAVVKVRPGSAQNGVPMAPCSSCNEMNGKLGIIDMNATHASSSSGGAGGSAGAAATAAERERRRD